MTFRGGRKRAKIVSFGAAVLTDSDKGPAQVFGSTMIGRAAHSVVRYGGACDRMGDTERATARPPNPAIGGQLVRPVAVLLGVLRDFGVESGDVLRDCGVPANALDDPQGRIPFDTVGALLACAARRTGCEHIGIVAGERLGLASMAAVGELARCAPSVGEALAAITVHHHVNSPGALAFYGAEAGHVTLAVAAYNRSTLGLAHFCDAVALMTLNVLRDLTAPDFCPDAILLARSAPRDLAPYRRAFPAQLVFDAEYTGVRFPEHVLARKVPTANPQRYAELEARIAAMGRHSLVNDVRRALRAELVRGHASAGRVTAVLDMHQRTLHRRLAEVGTTFQAVLDEVRYDAARHYLEVTAMPLVNVAAALGYSELSAFTRAFRRWAGVTPGTYRRQRGAGLPDRRNDG